jgi:Tfp pilus assembly protein PilE
MRPSQTRSGLTIVEAIVVIFVIVILLGLLLPAGPGAHNASRKASAMNDLTQFVTAVNQFHTDYGDYPIDSTVHQKTDLVYEK